MDKFEISYHFLAVFVVKYDTMRFNIHDLKFNKTKKKQFNSSRWDQTHNVRRDYMKKKVVSWIKFEISYLFLAVLVE